MLGLSLPRMTLACQALGVVHARRGDGVPRGTLPPGRLVLNPRELQIQDQHGTTIAGCAREDITHGWYCPALSSRVSGPTDGLDPTWAQSGVPWLILGTRDGRWVAASTARDEAYALLDAIGAGPRQRAWRAWLYLRRVPALRDPRLPLWAGALPGAFAVWLVPSLLLTFFGSALVLSNPPSFRAFCAASAAVWVAVALARWAGGFRRIRAERERLHVTLDDGRAGVAVDRIEAIRCGIYDVVIEARGATNPLRVTLRPTASAGTTGAEPALDDAARLAHAVFDWALATQEARARHQSALERVSARVSGQLPRAELEPDATPLRPASYREQPLDEASLVLLATDLDSPAHLRTAAVATIRAQGSEEARARVEGALRTFRRSRR